MFSTCPKDFADCSVIGLDNRLEKAGSRTSGAKHFPKLVFLSPADPRNRWQWAGTTYSIFNALKRRDPNIQFISGGVFEFIGRALGRVFRIFGKHWDIRHSKLFAFVVGSLASFRLSRISADAVVAVAADNYTAFLRTEKPIIYIHDATYAAIERIYPNYKLIPTWLRREARSLDVRSLRNASHVIYSSEWAKRSAIEDYALDGENIIVMPFGPNFDWAIADEFRTLKTANFRDQIKLLWIGRDWIRKNGALVVEIARELQRAGLPCEVYLVGDIPATLEATDGIHAVGLLDKGNPAELHRLCELFEQADFFMLPSTADATPIVFSEAQFFGCPSVSYDVGGTASAVLDNETGIVLPLSSTAAEFSERIKQLVQDPSSYEAMSRNARRRYEQSANWDVWADTIGRLASTKVM